MYDIEDFIVHGSYLIGDLSKPFQSYLMKQELQIAAKAGAVAYIIHAHSASQLKTIEAIRKKYKGTLLKGMELVVENTSHALSDSDIIEYKRKLIRQPVIIDTAHLYSSGIAETTD